MKQYKTTSSHVNTNKTRQWNLTRFSAFTILCLLWPRFIDTWNIMLFLHEAYWVSSCLIVGLPRQILCAHLHFRYTQHKFIKQTLGSKRLSQPLISIRIFNPAIRRRLNFYSSFHLISRVSYLRLRVRSHEPRNESQTIFKFQIGLNVTKICLFASRLHDGLRDRNKLRLTWNPIRPFSCKHRWDNK